MHIKISYSGQVVKKLSESFPNNTQSWITLPQDNESMRSHQTFYFWMSYSWKGLAQKKYPNNSIPLARLQHVSIPRTSVATPIYIKSDMTGFRYLWFFVAFLCGVINVSPLSPFLPFMFDVCMLFHVALWSLHLLLQCPLSQSVMSGVGITGMNATTDAFM